MGSISVRTQFGGFRSLHLMHLSLDNKNVIKRVYCSICIGVKCLETKKQHDSSKLMFKEGSQSGGVHVTYLIHWSLDFKKQS